MGADEPGTAGYEEPHGSGSLRDDPADRRRDGRPDVPVRVCCGEMRGIILAGGTGTRLQPITKGICKQLMPVYDKPMIYYPLSTLMMAGIREILSSPPPRTTTQFQRAARRRLAAGACGSSTPCSRARRASPRRSSSARSSSATSQVALVLGDNIFYGAGLGRQLREQRATRRRADLRLPGGQPAARTASWSSTTTARVLSIEEKPAQPK